MHLPARLKSLLVALVLAVLVALLPGAGAHAAGTGRITGTVTGPDGAPLSGVSVSVMPSGGGSGGIVPTNDLGAYELSGLTAGSYRVYFYESTHLSEYYDNATNYNDATLVTIAEGGDEEANAQLFRGGHIKGLVTGMADAALSGVDVTAYTWMPFGAGGAWNPVSYAKTDANGYYDLSRLTPDTYRIGFADPANDHVPEFYADAATVEAATNIPLAQDATEGFKNAHLVATGRLTGTVTNAAGTGLPGVNVTAYAPNTSAWGFPWTQSRSVQTNSAGFYDLRGLVAGTYRIGFRDFSDSYAPEFLEDAATVTDATSISVAEGDDLGDNDAVLAATGHVTGTVTGAGDAALAGVRVSAYAWVSYGSGPPNAWSYVKTVTTASTGAYDLSGLAPGTYRVGFQDQSNTYAAEFYDNVATVEAATSLVVGDGKTVSDKNARLGVNGRITGKVTGDADAGLAGVSVAAYTWDSRSGGDPDWHHVKSVMTSSSGAYQLTGLAPGDYRIGFFEEWSSDYVGEYFDDAATIEEATDVTVSEGEPTDGLNARLSRADPTTPTPTPTPTTSPTASPTTAPTTAPTPPAPPAAVPALTPTQIAVGLGEVLGGTKVTGRPAVGKTLKLLGLDSSFRTNVSYKIKWYAAKAAIKKATKPKLKLTSALKGKVISVKVTATSGGVSKSRKIKVGKVK